LLVSGDAGEVLANSFERCLLRGGKAAKSTDESGSGGFGGRGVVCGERLTVGGGERTKRGRELAKVELENACDGRRVVGRAEGEPVFVLLHPRDDVLDGSEFACGEHRERARRRGRKEENKPEVR
jgi:hypothetical protein